MDVTVSAEMGVIGSLLISPEIAGELFTSLRGSEFSNPVYAHIFAAALGVFEAGRPLDAVTVAEAAGREYLPIVTDIVQMTPTAANWRTYAAAVRDSSRLAAMQEAATAVCSASTVGDARAALQSASELLADAPGMSCTTLAEGMSEFLARQNDQTPPKYLRWGIKQLDERLTSERGDFVVIGADSSVGKTAWALQLAYAMASAGVRVGFYSLETSTRKLVDRIVAQQASISLDKIKHKTMGREEFAQAIAVAKNSLPPLEIINAAGCTVSDIRAHSLSHRYEAVFIDYTQLISAPGRERWEIVTNISIDLHTFAQSTGTAVIALSQITAAAKSDKARREVTKDDLRESHQLKQDADIIILMSLEDPSDPGRSERIVRVAKNKDGPLGEFNMTFDAAHLRFSVARRESYRAVKKACAEMARNKFQEIPGQEAIPFERG